LWSSVDWGSLRRVLLQLVDVVADDLSRKTEIGYLHLTLLVQHDILRLQVTMHEPYDYWKDTFLVDFGHTMRNLIEKLKHLYFTQSTSGGVFLSCL